ncbi:hypothetical protein BGZ89_004087, partial [Linnemannia elongata]
MQEILPESTVELTQSFRLIGSMDIEEIPCDLIDGHYVVSWEDIEQVFPGVKHVKNGKVTVPMMKDPNRKRIEPHCIKHHAGVVLDVILSSAADDVHVDLPMATPANSRDDTSANPPANLPANHPAIPSTDSPADAPIDAPIDASADTPTNGSTDAPADGPTNPFGDDPVPLYTSADAAIDVPTCSPANASTNPAVDTSANPPKNNQTSSQSDACPSSVTVDVSLSNLPSSSSAKGSGTSSPMAPADSVSNLAIATRTSDDHSLTKQYQGFQSAVIHKLDALHDQGAITQQIAQQVLQLSEEMKSRLILIQSKTEAILNQQLELAEYPIPRLFIVLPEEMTQYDPGNWFRTKFRLHFICECGKHTEPSNSKVQHHLHLAKHEGYLIREPTAFFEKYGPFLLIMLELIKFGTSVAGHVVPTLASLKVVELVDGVEQRVESVTAKINYSLECIDSQLEKVQASLPGDFVDTEPRAAMTQQGLDNYLSGVEGLEGVELRQLGSFLKTSQEENLLGNLYRMTTSDGHVKWVCRDHYRAGYQEKHVQMLRDVVKLAQGEFDEQLGKITITLRSSFAAAEFYSAVIKAKGVLELIVELRWECTRSDIEALHDALKKSGVPVLRLDIGQFGTSFGRSTFSKMLPSSRFKPLFHIIELWSMKTIHIVLPRDFVMLSDFHPKKPSHLSELSFELVPGSFGAKELVPLAEALKTNSTLTSLNLQENKIGSPEVQLMAEAFKTNSTLTTLWLGYNSIGDDGAQALSEALKTNSTLTTLELQYNSIGDNGAQALSEALKTNSTLTTLNLGNLIGPDGAQALAEALKTNSTLTTLNLHSNSIGPNGAQALAEALKTNSTLTNLDLDNNPIGPNGAQAMAEALKTNSTLTTLDLSSNSIGPKGAQALAEALKTNKALTTLDLRYNLIGPNGAQELSEALKTNSTLTTLNLYNNLFGPSGAQAMAEALKTNSTLTTLN